MLKQLRLTKAREFAAVRRGGPSWSDGLLVLRARRNNLEVSRFGFSVGKRLGNAVARNKLKRRLREVARTSPVQGGWDLVLIARRRASSADFSGISRSVTALLRRAGILAGAAQGTGPQPGDR